MYQGLPHLFWCGNPPLNIFIKVVIFWMVPQEMSTRKTYFYRLLDLSMFCRLHRRTDEWEDLRYCLYLCSRDIRGIYIPLFLFGISCLSTDLYQNGAVSLWGWVGISGTDRDGGYKVNFTETLFLSTPHCERLLLQE